MSCDPSPPGLLPQPSVLVPTSLVLGGLVSLVLGRSVVADDLWRDVGPEGRCPQLEMGPCLLGPQVLTFV